MSKQQTSVEEAREVLEALGYEVWEEDGDLQAERRLAGLIYRVYYGPEGDLRLEKVRLKPEEVREAMLAEHNGQFVRSKEVRESFFTACQPGELLELIKAWEA
ncbi:hypothetical protein [Oceanithermus sp.]